MNIGAVIKKYRKEVGLTQEEMANRLGVTTPAVNKWENGNSNPDIELLAPIARLLNISLDTLMSFHEKLTDEEISNIIEKIDDMISVEGYKKTFEWVTVLIKEYPNCNNLIWQAAVVLDAHRLTGSCPDPDVYDEQINAWYEIALNDENEEIQHRAADSLFGFYLRKKNYAMAEKYLSYFSEHDSMKKINQGRLYKEQGKTEEAYEMFETVIFSEYSTLNYALSFMVSLALEEGDDEYARFLADKSGNLAHVFDMGKYNEYSSMLDVVCAKKDVEGTYNVVSHLLENVETLGSFQKSQLYRHKNFREPDASYCEEIREKLLAGFRDEDEFEYMKGYEPWEMLIHTV